MKKTLFAMTLLAVCSSAFAENNVGMSKNCTATESGKTAGTTAGGAAGGGIALWLTGTACALSIAGSVFTFGAASPAAVSTCTATAALVTGSAMVGGAIIGGIAGGKAGEKVGKTFDGAGCE